jgi:thymidylate synthase (FAD)
MDDHAQWEIRQYARTIGHEIVRPLFPCVWEAFVDYRVESMNLTRLDQAVILRMAAKGQIPATEADFFANQDPSWSPLRRCRERDECLEKLKRLGLVGKDG